MFFFHILHTKLHISAYSFGLSAPSVLERLTKCAFTVFTKIAIQHFKSNNGKLINFIFKYLFWILQLLLFCNLGQTVYSLYESKFFFKIHFLY